MQLSNTFEGVSSGTTLTQGSGGNTGGFSGDYFDTFQQGSGAALTADNTHSAHGAVAAKFVTGASAVANLITWSTQLGGDQTKVWFRLYAYFTANPATVRPVARFLTSGATQCARLVINPSGMVQFNDGGNTSRFVTTNTIPLNQWFRLEGFVTGSATVGQFELKLFKTKDSLTPDETQTSAATLNNTGLIGQVQFGQTSVTAANVLFWLDDLGISSVAYMGPSPQPTGSGSVSMHKMTLTGSGAEKLSGSGSVNLRKMSLTGTETEKIRGSGSIELSKSSLSGTARAPIPGSGGIEFPKMGLTGIGNRTIKGSGSVTLNKMTVFGEFHLRPASELFIFTAV